MIRFVLALAVLLATPALALDPDEILADPAKEAFAREVSKDLRCVVCQNQSIDDSDAQIARDMRVKVRELVMEGKTKAQIQDYFVVRYGDYVLLEPPFAPSTYLLWFLPLILVIIAAAALIFVLRNRPRKPVSHPALNAQENARLDALLKDQDQ